MAVLSDAVEADELGTVPDPILPESALIVLVVPDLYATYNSVFVAAAIAEPPQSAA